MPFQSYLIARVHYVEIRDIATHTYKYTISMTSSQDELIADLLYPANLYVKFL